MAVSTFVTPQKEGKLTGFSVHKTQKAFTIYPLVRLHWIHCPSFICFCKPSPHLYTAGPLKLENSPHAPVAVDTCNHHECGDTDGETIAASKDFTDVDGKQRQEQQVENFAKSSLKKTSPDSKEVQKKRVQWPDLLGKELVEIREFEPRWDSVRLAKRCHNLDRKGGTTVGLELQYVRRYHGALSNSKLTGYFASPKLHAPISIGFFVDAWDDRLI
ncbi:hypothetical protein HS088_TW04G00800 [Tripterygium wilfordii]|uniref:Uncharacterized protein n=1 Tax=Tripterygium wilfordii TaxID=458696 RepID=A0A7J7DR41_TRIWF|nr:hypothetical protein HS088_TW04G00800 [Tripterygium wilfordii]